jgi:gamma-carbonic anhydrase
MNTRSTDDPRADLTHPDHLDYFAEIVSAHLDRIPKTAPGSYVAPRAFLSGAVTLDVRASVWPCASLRADIAPIVIGEESNVQDNAVVHVATGQGAVVGKRVTVGHSAVIHACTIGDNCLIGMGSIILDGAVIGANSLIGARTLILGDTVIPPGSMVVGSPGKVVRTLSAEEQKGLGAWADHYLVLAAEYIRRGTVHPDYAAKE